MHITVQKPSKKGDTKECKFVANDAMTVEELKVLIAVECEWRPSCPRTAIARLRLAHTARIAAGRVIPARGPRTPFMHRAATRGSSHVESTVQSPASRCRSLLAVKVPPNSQALKFANTKWKEGDSKSDKFVRLNKLLETVGEHALAAPYEC